MPLGVNKKAIRYLLALIAGLIAFTLLLTPQPSGATSTRFSQPNAVWARIAANLFADLLAPPVFGPNLRANSDTTTFGQHEPSLAVSRVHTNTLVAASKDYRIGNVKQVWIYASTDGGATWPTQLQMPGVPAELNNQSDPVVMARDDGRIYVACVAYREPDRSRAGVFITWSDDDGATWRNPSVPIYYPENQIDDKDWFAIDNNPASPYYHRMYMMYSPGALNVVEQHSTDGGLIWSERQQIAGSRYEYTYPVVASDGAVYNFMMYGWGAGQTGTIQYVKSADGGVTWSNRFTVAVAEQPESPIRPEDQFRFFAILSAAVDPNNGSLYVAWTDRRNIGSNGTDVLYVKSTDGGAAWSQPMRLSHDPPGVVRDHITPMLTVGADSRLHAFWLDRRLDPNNRLFDSWYSSSTDGGETWDPDTRVSTVSQDLNVGFPPASGNAAGDYWGLDTVSDTVYVAWNDTHTGNQDILVSKGLMYGGSTGTPTIAPTRTFTPVVTATPTPPLCAGAYHYFRPQAGSPPNGGTVNVGERFTLDMFLSAGPYSVTAQQAYLTFDYALLQNVNAEEAGCVLTNTVTGDFAVFEVELQNEVCNGPRRCTFRGLVVQPGNVAWASGALVNPPYTGHDFRLAQGGFCAVAPGQATIRWQFSPPAPRNRDTEVVEENGSIINIPACYTSYTVHIVGATPTPTGTPSCNPTFTDVQPTDYFYEPVRYLYCAGALTGYADNTLRPYSVTTRAQFCKIIVIAQGWPLNVEGGPHFDDVPTDNPFYGFVETAYNRGVITGYGDRTFGPNNHITRGQLCKIIVLAQGWAVTTSGGPHFNDVPADSPFYGFIETAYTWGVISGYADGAFRPSASTTRAQAAKMVYNALFAVVGSE